MSNLALRHWQFEGLSAESRDDAPPQSLTGNPVVLIKNVERNSTGFGIWEHSTVKGINEGRVVSLFRLISDGRNGVEPFLGFAFRFIDRCNHYRAQFNTGSDNALKNLTIYKVINGEMTSLLERRLLTRPIPVKTWVKTQITWWIAAKQLFIRIEIDFLDGSGFVQQGEATDTKASLEDNHNKIAICLGSKSSPDLTADIVEAEFEDTECLRGYHI